MTDKNKGFSEAPAKYGAKAAARADVLKVRPIGNSACVVLSKEMLAELGVQIGDELQVVKTPKGYEVSAFDAELDDALKWIEKGAKRYRNTLRALSK
ncbi:MAG: AbrB/MazE/SpoVT family DNA-binding domain-containing protein [Parvularculaceae bacterium]